MVACGFVEKARQVTAKDLHLRGRTVAAAVDGELRRDPAACIDPGGAFLARATRKGRLFQSEPTQNRSSDPAHVDVLAALAEGRGALHHGHLEAQAAQGEGERVARDARPRDENAARHGSCPFERGPARTTYPPGPAAPGTSRGPSAVEDVPAHLREPEHDHAERDHGKVVGGALLAAGGDAA